MELPGHPAGEQDQGDAVQWGGGRGAAQRRVLQPAGLTACTHISERHSHPERHSLPTASSGAIRSSLVCNPRWSRPPRAGTEQGAETGEVLGEREHGDREKRQRNSITWC